jgi:hypothetical protein
MDRSDRTDRKRTAIAAERGLASLEACSLNRQDVQALDDRDVDIIRTMPEQVGAGRDMCYRCVRIRWL